MIDLNKLYAMRDIVIVKVIHKDKATEGSVIILPETYEGTKKYAAYHGEVIAVGPKYKYGLKKGDKVAFMRLEGVPIYETIYTEEIMALKEEWVMGKVED